MQREEEKKMERVEGRLGQWHWGLGSGCLGAGSTEIHLVKSLAGTQDPVTIPIRGWEEASCPNLSKPVLATVWKPGYPSSGQSSHWCCPGPSYEKSIFQPSLSLWPGFQCSVMRTVVLLSVRS